MSNQAQVRDFLDRSVRAMDGDKIGTVTDVYLDEDTDQPEWLAVSTGMFGTKISFVPLAGASFDNDGNVVVPHAKSAVKDAPRAEADGRLSEDEERDLYTHYGRPYMSDSALQPRTASDSAGEPTARPDANASMLRSEEELSIDKHSRETGRVKLRKWVESDNVQVTVPVERQMARVVRESVTDADATGLDQFVEGEEEIVLSEEVVDVSKNVVARERVSLKTETVTDQVAVDESVRKERIEIDGDAVGADTVTGESDRR